MTGLPVAASPGTTVLANPALAGAFKIACDLLLRKSFRGVRPG